jgi:hypothetical protein
MVREEADVIRKGSQNHRVLLALADHQWHTTAAIHRAVGPCRLNSRVAELRDRHGFDIWCEQIPGRTGAHAFRYRLASDIPRHLVEDDLRRRLEARQRRDEVPRTPDTRFRLYRLAGSHLELLDTAATLYRLGGLLIMHAEMGRFAGSAIGVLDTHGTDEKQGHWIINPWDTTP